MINILENIEAIRKRNGIKQSVVAEALGVKQPAYSNYITRNSDIYFNRLSQIADVLNVPVVDIITYPDKYEKVGSKKNTTKVLVELDVSTDEFLKLGLKDKILQILNEK